MSDQPNLRNLLITLALTTTAMVVFEFCGCWEWVGGPLLGNRAQLYNTVTGVFATFAGFVLTGMTFLEMMETARLQVLRKSRHYGTLLNIYSFTLTAMVLGVVFGLVGLVFDRDPLKPEEAGQFRPMARFIGYIVLGCGLFAGLQMERLLWVFRNLGRAGEANPSPA